MVSSLPRLLGWLFLRINFHTPANAAIVIHGIGTAFAFCWFLRFFAYHSVLRLGGFNNKPFCITDLNAPARLIFLENSTRRVYPAITTPI